MSEFPTPEPVADDLVNVLTGLGGSSARTGQTLPELATPLTATELEALVTDDWLARRIVEGLPGFALADRDPTVQWDEFDRVNASELYPQGVLLQGLFQGRGFGGALILVGFRLGDPKSPAPADGSKTPIAWLDTVPWHQITVLERETDRNSARVGQPTVYKVTGTHPRTGLEIHATRTIACEGLARFLYSPTATTPWLSVLQPVWKVIRDYGVSWEGVSELLLEASVGVFKMHGLFEMLASKNQATVSQRMSLMAQGKSVARALFLDAKYGEDFSRTNVSFADIPLILQQLQSRVSGAAEMPAPLLFGQSPNGLNATGESDTRSWYDRVEQYRRTSLRPKLVRLLGWLNGGTVDLQFPPLWKPTAKEQADLRTAAATVDRTYYEIGALDPEQIVTMRKADGTFPESVPQPTERDEESEADRRNPTEATEENPPEG